jgi:hypothetical protein
MLETPTAANAKDCAGEAFLQAGRSVLGGPPGKGDNQAARIPRPGKKIATSGIMQELCKAGRPWLRGRWAALTAGKSGKAILQLWKERPVK